MKPYESDLRLESLQGATMISLPSFLCMVAAPILAGALIATAKHFASPSRDEDPFPGVVAAHTRPNLRVCN
jgi:hypothetical protein